MLHLLEVIQHVLSLYFSTVASVVQTWICKCIHEIELCANQCINQGPIFHEMWYSDQCGVNVHRKWWQEIFIIHGDEYCCNIANDLPENDET